MAYGTRSCMGIAASMWYPASHNDGRCFELVLFCMVGGCNWTVWAITWRRQVDIGIPMGMRYPLQLLEQAAWTLAFRLSA